LESERSFDAVSDDKIFDNAKKNKEETDLKFEGALALSMQFNEEDTKHNSR
jgi:hypothetical protein